MQLTMIRRFSILMVIALASVVIHGQPAPDDKKIDSLRGTIQRLLDITADPNIPRDNKNQISDLLFDKGAELHTLLRQKRDAIEARLKSTTSAAEVQTMGEAIRQLGDEMRRLRTNISQTPPPQTVPLVSDSKQPGTSPPVADPPTNTLQNADPGVVPQNQPPAQQPVVMDDRCKNLPKADSKDINDLYRLAVRHDICTILRDKGKPFAPLSLTRNNELILKAMLWQAANKGKKLAVAELTAQAENASNSKQVGGNESNGGSTSLTSKPGLPAIFGIAVENGALTRTDSGTTVTFTGNPTGIIQAMAKKGFIDSFQEQAEFTAFLRRLSFGVSFDTTQGNLPGTTTFTGDKQQLAGYSLKYSLLDQRDPRLKKYTRKWEDLTSEQAADLAEALNVFVKSALENPARVPGLKAWVDETNKALTSASTYDDIQTILVSHLDKLSGIEFNWPPEAKALVEGVGTKFDAYLKKKNEILGEIANGWLATLEYNNLRPLGSPSLSNIRFLSSKGTYNGSLDFTGNASMTFYNSKPVGVSGRLRDFRFSTQLDVPLGEVSKTGKFLLSFAGRYERLLNDELIPGTTEVIRKGDIAIGQVKLTIPIRGTAIKIPLSMTFANRTELVKEKEVRGNFGITFDLDSIMAKFNPFTQK